MTSLLLPRHLAEKAASFSESSYGATIVTLVLTDGRRISDVTLAWSKEVVRVGTRRAEAPEQLGFDIAAVQDVEPQ